MTVGTVYYTDCVSLLYQLFKSTIDDAFSSENHKSDRFILIKKSLIGDINRFARKMADDLNFCLDEVTEHRCIFSEKYVDERKFSLRLIFLPNPETATKFIIFCKAFDEEHVEEEKSKED